MGDLGLDQRNVICGLFIHTTQHTWLPSTPLLALAGKGGGYISVVYPHLPPPPPPPSQSSWSWPNYTHSLSLPSHSIVKHTHSLTHTYMPITLPSLGWRGGSLLGTLPTIHGLVSQTHSFKHIRPSPTTCTHTIPYQVIVSQTHSSTYDLLPPRLHNSLPSYCITIKLTHSSTYDLLPPHSHNSLPTYCITIKLTHSSTYDLLPPHSHNSLPSYCITNSLIQAHTTFSHHNYTILHTHVYTYASPQWRSQDEQVTWTQHGHTQCVRNTSARKSGALSCHEIIHYEIASEAIFTIHSVLPDIWP